MPDAFVAAQERDDALPSLLVSDRDGREMTVALGRRFVLLGRHRHCDVRLNDPDVSMRHAIAIRFACGGVYLLDLDSRNGIGFNGQTQSGVWLASQKPAAIQDFRVTVSGCRIADSNDADPTRGFLGDIRRIPDIELRFTAGSLSGTSYRLKRAITLIGRGSKCKVRLRDDANVSQVHACLLLDEQGLSLVDTISRCGTLIDGQRVHHARLQEGQRIAIGTHEIEVSRCRQRETGARDVPAEGWTDALQTDGELIGPALARILRELRDVPESDRNGRVDELLGAGTISAWQSRKIRRKDPTRLILDDRFLMMEPVGRGGMATVYRGYDLETNEVVALKVPEIRVSDAARRRARLRREFTISSSLRHPHIVRLRDFGRDLRFLVFDFVRGKPLSRLIAEHGSLDPGFVAQWFSEIADALAYARGKGVIHRDIKPENIMITDRNAAMLLDLGLACLTQDEGGGSSDSTAGLTRIGFTVGTLEFMSPEQAAATGDIDSRADIYSLGCTMYNALSGRPPFQSQNPAELTRQHLEASPPQIANLDPELTGIVIRAMQKLPSDRYQTPEDLRDALREWKMSAVVASG